MDYYSTDVARETGMSTEGLRYYEKKGIIRFHKNHENGYRTYPIMQVPLLRMVKILNSYGVPLAEVGELLHHKDNELDKLLTVMENKQNDLQKKVWREHRLLERLEEQTAVLKRVVNCPDKLWFVQKEDMCYLEYYGAEQLRRNKELQEELERWLEHMPLVYPMPVLHREDVEQEDPYCPAGMMAYEKDMENLGLVSGNYTRKIPKQLYLCGISVQREKTRIQTRETIAPILSAMEEMNLSLAGDIYFMSVAATEPEPADTQLYYQVMVPVTGNAEQ